MNVGPRIYLDYAAKAPVLPEVVQAIADALERYPGNPSSQHAEGREARRALDETLRRIGQLFGADIHDPSGERIILTSGGSEANNLALLGRMTSPSDHAIVSQAEHSSVRQAADELQRQGYAVDRVPLDENGVLRVADLAGTIGSRTRVVSITLASNETGVVQPISEAAAICQRHGVPLHVDAVQAVGKLPIDFRSLGLSAMTISGHKLGGPVGVGALLIRQDFSLRPLFYGGGQQGGYRPGTEPVALAVGLLAACEAHMSSTGYAAWRQVAEMRQWFEAKLAAELPNIVVHGARASRLPHISCISFPGRDRQAMQMALDLVGVACSTGSACASGSSEPSPVLLAMGLDRAMWDSALRFSLGPDASRPALSWGVRRIIQVHSNLRVASGT